MNEKSRVLIKPTGKWRFRFVRRPLIIGKLYPEWRFDFDEPLSAPPPGVTFSYLFPDVPAPTLDGTSAFVHSNPEKADEW